MPETNLCLVFRVLTFHCALPLEHVSETMRPLPVEPIAGVISPVAGVAIIRGGPVPVVDVALNECERYYPAFQYVIWGGKAPGEAVTAACLDPQGEA